MYPIISTTAARDELVTQAKERVNPSEHDDPLHLSALIIDAYGQPTPATRPVFQGPAESSGTRVSEEVKEAISLAKPRSEVTTIAALRMEENVAFETFHSEVLKRL
jgi:hypothetical protein